MRKLIVHIADAETGEILGSNDLRYDKYSDEGALKTKINYWYMSFLRGLAQQRDLTLMITIRRFKSEELLDFK